jgi:Holliday junction resolvasome RuvABC endonuclease subunit
VSKIKLSDIKGVLEPEGWQVLSSVYQNLDTPMDFKCAQGHTLNLPWKRLRDTLQCPICALNAQKDLSQKIVAKTKETKRILAIDQATKVSGYAIFDGKVLKTYGVYDTQAEEEGLRYQLMKEWLISMITAWKPDYIAIEGIQFQSKEVGATAQLGITTFEKLARLQGVLIETAFELKTPLTIVPTNTWRGHCGVRGKSRVDKKQSAQQIVKLAYDVSVTNDEADSILIGKYMIDKIVENTEVTSWE